MADDLLASSASDPTGLLDRLRAATAGELKIIRELGRGGMGRVFLAHEAALERRVALKVLPPEFAENDEVIQRFQREARTAGKLSHPHIVPVYQVSERSGIFFFTMPYVAGPSLRQILRQTPQLSVELCRRYLREAADALSYAHRQGVIHRDIKPENMLLEGSRDGRLLLTDFGIAKAMGSATTLTRPGDMIGTPFFMSPEQCEKDEAIDGRSDQYSLGLVAYEMLAGRFPFVADSLAGIVYKHLHEYPPPLAQLRPDVPDDLRVVIERAIRKRPDERFPDMPTMLEALGPALLRRYTAPVAPRVVSRRPPRRRRRAFWFGAGALVALAVAVAAGVAWLNGSLADDAQMAESPPPAAVIDEPSADVERQPLQAAATDLAPLQASAADTGPTPTESLVAARQQASPPAVAAPGEDAAVRRARRAAEAAEEQAALARATAGSVGADSLHGAEFAEADAQFSRAVAALRAGRFRLAMMDFEAARKRFEDLAAAAEAERRAAAERVDVEAKEAEAVVPAESDREIASEPVTPEAAIAALIEAYRRAIEAEDMGVLSGEVYRGAIPADNLQFLEEVFRRADSLAVSIDMEGLNLDGESARAQVKQTMRYRLAATRQRRDYKVDLDLFFERTPEGWRLERFER